MIPTKATYLLEWQVLVPFRQPIDTRFDTRSYENFAKLSKRR